MLDNVRIKWNGWLVFVHSNLYKFIRKLILFMRAGILIGAQRSQIRGTYGIEGSITQDACLGLFLPWCTQIQNDREVRAREGAQELRNSKRYKDFEKSNGVVDQQPKLVPPMNLPGGLNHLYVPLSISYVPLSLVSSNIR